jgi:hypothetical protein
MRLEAEMTKVERKAAAIVEKAIAENERVLAKRKAEHAQAMQAAKKAWDMLQGQ